jgi:hypothetical protein
MSFDIAETSPFTEGMDGRGGLFWNERESVTAVMETLPFPGLAATCAVGGMESAIERLPATHPVDRTLPSISVVIRRSFSFEVVVTGVVCSVVRCSNCRILVVRMLDCQKLRLGLPATESFFFMRADRQSDAQKGIQKPLPEFRLLFLFQAVCNRASRPEIRRRPILPIGLLY